MPGNDTPHLRIFCICGQKMKVSGKMFGLPGKCVACSQKIRIPRLDEIPEGTEEISLRDHPEFLRKGRKSSKRSGNTAPPKSNPVILGGDIDVAVDEGEYAIAIADTPPEDVALGDELENLSTVPLDVLEPLRNLCSLKHKLERQLETLGGLSEKKGLHRENLDVKLEKVATARAGLDEQLRQILMEVAIELAGTQDKIVQTSLAARVGEIAFASYLETVDRLRRRRDRLERRQQDLRGWLATHDPHIAGGFQDLPTNSIPSEGYTISLPSDYDESDSLLNIHIATLREAFHRRARAEHKLAEMERMREGASDSNGSYRDAGANTRADRKIADETVAFARERLKQLFDDYDNEAETIDAQQELTQGRLQLREISRAQFDALEKKFGQAKSTTAKAKTLIRRALNANSAQDVPQPRGTLLGRLGRTRPSAPTAIDALVARGAALSMGVAIFIPALVGHHSLASAFLNFTEVPAILRFAFLVPLLYGVGVALISGIEHQAIRGRLIGLVWILFTAIGAYIIHEAQLGLDVFSARFREGAPWFLRPSMLIMLLAHLAVLASVGQALFRIRGDRVLVGAIPFAGILIAILISSDVFGVFLPRPVVSVEPAAYQLVGQTADVGPAGLSMTISISNQGRRVLYLAPVQMTARGAYRFSVERREEDTWSPEKLSRRPNSNVGTFGDALFGQPPVNAPTRLLATIPPGAVRSFELSLQSGEYRVTLECDALDEEIIFPFNVQGPQRAEEATGGEGFAIVVVEPGEAESAKGEFEVEEAVSVQESLVPSPEVRLSAIVSSPEGEPQFSFVLYFEDGREERLTLRRGDVLFGPWTVAEYNTRLRNVTLTLGNQVLAVHLGDKVELEIR